jgi:hypothetical protein
VEIENRLSNAVILNHTAEMFDSVVSKEWNSQNVLLALSVGLLIGWMV